MYLYNLATIVRNIVLKYMYYNDAGCKWIDIKGITINVNYVLIIIMITIIDMQRESGRKWSRERP